MVWTVVAFALALAVGLAAWLTRGKDGPPTFQEVASQYRGWPVDPVIEAPDFTLVDQHGREFRLSDQRGRAVVLFFGYTMCPDVCPATLAHLRDVKRELGPAAEDVRFVFVTVDPERDTQERLARYLALFDQDFVGLTGERAALEKMWSDYGVYVERVDNPQNPENYAMNHTSLTYIVDKQGRLLLVHPFGMPREDVVHDLQVLVQSGA